MLRIIAQVRKELTQISRDRLTLALALLLPVILLLLLSTAISLTVTDLPIIVQDLDQTPLSQKYIDSFRASLTFRVESWPTNRRPEEALITNVARSAIIIPQHFEEMLWRGENAEVQILIDATDANTANLVRAAASVVSQSFLAQQRVAPVQQAIRPAVRLWYNPGRETRKFMAAGVFAVGMALFPPLLAALAMSREGEQQTILQVYVSSISAHEFLLGKILAYFIISLCEWILGLMVVFGFGLRFAGDVSPLIVCTVLYLFCNVSFGTMVGATIPNQAAAIQAVQILAFLLSFLLSGLTFPISNIPKSISWISNIIPARYYIEVTRDAFLRGGGWPAVWHAPVVLTIIGLTFFTLAWRRMRRMQVQS